MITKSCSTKNIWNKYIHISIIIIAQIIRVLILYAIFMAAIKVRYLNIIMCFGVKIYDKLVRHYIEFIIYIK